MAKNNSISARVRREKNRLLRLYNDLDADKMQLAVGLIDRAAWMRVQCEDLEVFLINNGWTEPFQQSKDLAAYDRARPQGQTYQSLNSNYQKIIHQLDGMLPDKGSGIKDDGFEAFVQRRDNA